MGKESSFDAGGTGGAGLILESGRSPGGGHGNPLSILAWRISWTEEPGGLQSIGSQSQTQLKQLSTHACIDFFKKNLKLENSHMSVLSLGCMA